MKFKLRDIRAVISEALPLCQPTEAERRKISGAAEKCRRLVQDASAGKDQVVDVIFGGSYAKGTWLRGDADVDIFVKMTPTVDLATFERLGKSIGLSALARYRPKMRYSDHPYVEAAVDGIRVNVVPCYDVERGKWQSAADRSPFHTEYIMNNFGDAERTQTRLLKVFFKSTGVYGAEIAVGGFSGYVSEVLILKYRTLESVLQAAADLRRRQVIAVDDRFDPDVVKGFASPLIIIDPIDTRRNLGTAISPESVGNFVMAARAFLSGPSIRFFNGRAKRHSAPKKIYSNVLIVEFRHRERSPDIVWGQLKRTLAAITRQLELADFKVFRSSCVTDEKKSAVLAFLLDSLTLTPFAKRTGPELYMKDNVASFLDNSKTAAHAAWVGPDLRASVLIDRKVTSARSYVRSLFGKDSVNSGISRDMLDDRLTLRVYGGSERRLSGLAKDAADRIVSTEHFILRRT